MKTRLLILTVSALFLSACSSSLYVGSGYDDLYYTPGDEPAVLVREDPSAFQDSYRAIDNVERPGSSIQETLCREKASILKLVMKR